MENLIHVPNNVKNIFNLTIHSDGFGTCINFVRMKIKEAAEKAELELEGFSAEEMNQLFLQLLFIRKRTKSSEIAPPKIESQPKRQLIVIE